MDEPKNVLRDSNPSNISYESDTKQQRSLTSLLKGRLSRRELLKAGGLTGLSLSTLWALACQQATPTPTPAKPAAVTPATLTLAAPTPTQAPPAIVTTAETKIGKALIGKLEGPEIITDPAKFPKAFKEAPALAELVTAGKLPAAKERIGEDPLVVKPLQETGKYGGTWRRGFTGPGDQWNGRRAAGSDSILYWDYAETKAVPNIAKGWEMSDGGRTFTLLLRKGMKWSNGQPFTADDFVFWHQDMDQNKELNPIPAVEMTINGKPGVLEKVDTYTARFMFPDPYYMLPDMLAATTLLGGHSLRGLEGTGGYAPAHYLKQYHPKYVSKEELDKKVKDAKFDNWVKLFKFKADWALNPECPALTSWVTKTPINNPTWVLERNPYSIWVDTEGNQLPYIDRIQLTLAENLEVLNLRAIAGEYDFQARHLDIAKVPIFLQNQAKGGYKLYLDPGDYGCDGGFRVNMSYDKDPEVAKWLNNVDFRHALSLGIDRDQLNETFWLGTGTPGSPAPEETNRFSPGPEWRTKWSTYDPKQANEMLDKIGLDKKDTDGYRLRTDGKGRLRIEVQTFGGMFVQYTQIAEMIREHYKKIGIQLDVMEVERSLGLNRSAANEVQIFMWNNDGSGHVFVAGTHILPVDTSGWSYHGPLFGKWFASGGKEGKEPPRRMREVMDMYRKGPGLPDEERIKVGKEIWKIVLDDVWFIGTVGLSAAAQGVRVSKTNIGNVPARMGNNVRVRTPAISRTMTFFWKS